MFCRFARTHTTNEPGVDFICCVLRLDGPMCAVCVSRLRLAFAEHIIRINIERVANHTDLMESGAIT